jgi:hypothetical protein
LEDQPESKTKKTMTELIQKNIKIEFLMVKKTNDIGITIQTNNDKTNDITGDILYVILLDRKGVRVCFLSNLKASSKG